MENLNLNPDQSDELKAEVEKPLKKKPSDFIGDYK